MEFDALTKGNDEDRLKVVSDISQPHHISLSLSLFILLSLQKDSVSIRNIHIDSGLGCCGFGDPH